MAMNSRSIAALVLLALGALGADSREAEVAKAHQSFQIAWAKYDVSALDRLFSDDLIWVHRDGGISDKATMIATFKRRGMTIPQSESDLRIRVYGDAAVVTARHFNRDNENEKKMHTIVINEVWAKTSDGGWKLVSLNGTEATAKE
jgi:ketosteroid isomerase-like protein